MSSKKQFTVATTEQLLGGNASQQAQTSSKKVKTVMKINKSGHSSKGKETLKAVRFTPSTKGCKEIKEVEKYIADFPASGIGESRLERKTAIIRKPTIRLDTSYLSPETPPVSEPANKSTYQKGSEIYFAPIETNRSFIWLSSPKKSPEDIAALTEASLSSPVFSGNANETFCVTPSQLNQLVSALAKSPLIRDQIQRQWWNPPLYNLYIDESPGPSVPAIYSHANHQFVARPLSFENPSNESPILPHGLFTSFSRSSDITSLAIVDPTTHGSPIRFLSRPLFSTSSVGSCTYLNLAYGSTIESHLRIDEEADTNITSSTAPSVGSAAVIAKQRERSSSISNPKSNQSKKTILQISSRILDRKSNRRRSYALVVEIDVSVPLRRAALAELASATKRPLTEISIAPAPENQKNVVAGAEVDWIALADRLQQTAEVADAVEVVADRLKSLKLPPQISSSSNSSSSSSASQGTGTQETQSFLRHTRDLTEAFSRFWILRPGKETHESSGVPKSIGIPWVSGKLAAEIEEGKWNDCDEVLSSLVERVAKVKGGERHEFVETLRGERVRFVPCFGETCGRKKEEEEEEGGEVGVWVCFLQGLDLSKGV